MDSWVRKGLEVVLRGGKEVRKRHSRNKGHPWQRPRGVNPYVALGEAVACLVFLEVGAQIGALPEARRRQMEEYGNKAP